MHGLRNFRDVGESLDPSHPAIAAGQLFRCGHLARLHDEAKRDLLARPWSHVIDLRYPDECRRDPSPWPNETRYRLLNVGGGSSRDAPHLEMFMAARAEAHGIDAVNLSFYREIPFDPLYRPLFAEAVGAIAASEGPVLVHCTAGKDRTGILVALILSLLGVDRSLIVEDYLKSTRIVTPEFTESMREQLEKMTGETVTLAEVTAMLTVSPDYIVAMFDAVSARSGSVADYFAEAGIGQSEIGALRNRMGSRLASSSSSV
ncbi:tyrosine-protein phosphatase [Altererythrobacter sp. FM1]|uniref:tyrosine-protein phosphatase n=1 Tax=Tsuneonella flava TaxID=2055955 RepID=UPI000C7F7F2D|nr:tyrosine-protein phosphatase [Tsuneonella flava]ROT93943.1 tyrosine-protein phosphatase [Altererythrobacter sp. FM1]